MAFRNVCKIVSVVLGPLLIILGVCVKWAIFPPLVDNLVHSYLTLEPSNTDTWEAWMEPTSQQPLFMKFTFFNVENAEEIVANNAKPRVAEKGAFAYREVRRKEHVRSLLDEISYGSYTHYEFDADESDEGSKDPETKVTIINPVLAIINAVQLQLHEELLERASFDTIFSWLSVDCVEQLEGKTVAEALCPMIPAGEYDIPCSLIPGDLGGMICNFDSDGDGEDDVVRGTYDPVSGMFTVPGTALGDLPLECRGTLEEAFPKQFKYSIDCTDPLNLWVRVEDFLLDPLKAKVNCLPEQFPVNVSECSGDNEHWYDQVPEKCFCDGLTMTDTVNNLIFKGAHSGMLLALHNVLEDANLGNFMPNLDLIITLLPGLFPNGNPLTHVNLADWIDQTLAGIGMDLLDLKHGKFGFFRGPNGSNATRAWWKINSGKYQSDLYNQITEFNGMTRLPENWWDSFGPTPSAQASGVRGICHDIIGADGHSYPPEAITKEDPIWIFNDQLSRSIWLDFIQEADVDGITTYQYSPKPEVFSMTDPDNFCYCPKVEQCAKVDETAEDAWDISDCQDKTLKLLPCIDGLLFLEGPYKVPLIMSTPHFLDADESLWEAIDGVQPEREKHITFLNIEPATGMSLQIHQRIQVNVPVGHSDYFQDLRGFQDPVNRTVWPVVWVDEGADTNQENLDLLKSNLVDTGADANQENLELLNSKLVTPLILVDIGTGLLIGIGGVLLILSAALHFFCKPSQSLSKI